jgi:prepilin-type N-terminal cleavage/methylation domain-containing protein
MFLSAKNTCMRPSHGMHPRARRCGGFTLVEMVLVIILAGIIFSLGSVMLGKVFSSYAMKRDTTDADWQAKVALERMTRELRAVRSATAADLDVASGTQLRFVDTDGNGVCFYRNGGANRVMRSADGPTTVCGTTNPQPLADSIASLTFTYWENTGAEVLPGGAAASVYYITVAINVAEGSYNSSFRTNVRPRNF